MKKIKSTLGWIVILTGISSFILNGCKDIDGPPPSDPPINETELVTTVKLVFTDTANNDTRTAYFYDIDGPGGNAPTILDTINLTTNRLYLTQIYLLDESKNPVDSISNEVLEEGDDHLFVYTKTGVNLTISITDKDKNNLPVGLTSNWSTGAASTGSVKVTLKHQPGVKDGTPDTGETDVEIVFPCRIK